MAVIFNRLFAGYTLCYQSLYSQFMKQEYARLVTLAAWAATIIASILLVVKVAAWWVTGSVSLLASVVDSLLDIAASVVNLVVVRYSLQPADKEHTFGHGKAESLAALAQAMFISGSACFLILNGIERFFRPHELNSPEIGIYVSLFAIVMTFGLVRFQKHVVSKTGQPSDSRRFTALSIRPLYECSDHARASTELVWHWSSGLGIRDWHRYLHSLQCLPNGNRSHSIFA